jgi:hypothetical protein
MLLLMPVFQKPGEFGKLVYQFAANSVFFFLHTSICQYMTLYTVFKFSVSR